MSYLVFRKESTRSRLGSLLNPTRGFRVFTRIDLGRPGLLRSYMGFIYLHKEKFGKLYPELNPKLVSNKTDMKRVFLSLWGLFAKFFPLMLSFVCLHTRLNFHLNFSPCPKSRAHVAVTAGHVPKSK